jgi:putative transcriptional regulator
MISISPKVGRIDYLRVDATTDANIALQQAEDEIESMQEVASFVRQIRQRLGLSQIEFARLISVSLNTMRNWEKGYQQLT